MSRSGLLSAGSGAPRGSLFETAVVPLSPDPPTLAITDKGVQSASNPTPMWVSREAGRLFGAYTLGRALMESTDDGANWTTLHTFVAGDGGNIQAVRLLDNGECLVSLQAAAGAYQAALMLSSGFVANPSTATWTRVLQTFDTVNFLDRCISCHGNVVLVCSYGAAPKADARYVWVSTNYGQTFTQILDLQTHPTISPDKTNTHTHGVAFDPWEERLWLSVGDGVNSGIYYAPLSNPTNWTLAAVNQPVTLIATKAGMLMGCDNAPYGLQRIRRWGEHRTPVLDMAWTAPEGVIGTRVTSRGRPGDPIFFGFGPLDAGTHGYLIATADGETFYVVHSLLTAGSVIDAFYGPTNGGFLHGSDRPGGTARVVRAPAPEWIPAGGATRLAAALPWRIEVNPFTDPVSNVNWSTLTASGNIGGGWRQSSSAQNAELNWDVMIPAGTWTISLIHNRGTDRGIYTFSLDGTDVGTIDGYNSATNANTLSSITGVVVAATGKKRLRVRMATKNATSTSYLGLIQALSLLRTA